MEEENHHLCCVFFKFSDPHFQWGKKIIICVAFLKKKFSDPHFQWGKKIIICVAFFLFSDPHFQWGKKIIICVAFFFIFRPKFSMGEENHHLCCVFFSNSAKTPLCTTPLHLLSLPAHPSSFMMRWE